VQRNVEQLGLLLVRHGWLDRLLTARDHHAVALLHQVVEGRVLERLMREAGNECSGNVERLERHRLAVGQPQTTDQHHARVRRNVECASDCSACMGFSELDRPAPGHHSPAAHVFAERRQRELLGDLRLADERAAPVPPLQVAVPDEVVERGAEGQSGDAEVGAEPAFGGDRLADAELLDQLEDPLPGQDLLAHVSPMEAQPDDHGQDHFAKPGPEFTPLTHGLVYANLPPVTGGLNQSGRPGQPPLRSRIRCHAGNPKLREAT
jgi:hypothetical protein